MVTKQVSLIGVPIRFASGIEIFGNAACKRKVKVLGYHDRFGRDEA